MHPALSRNTFLVKRRAGLLKAANDFDVYDAETGEVALECREESLGPVTRFFRFADRKRMTPFDIAIRTPEGQQVLRARRGVAVLLSKVEVLDERDRPIGGFRQKVSATGGTFDVLDDGGQTVCQLKGKWTSWEFRFLEGEKELARVTKKWAGLGKEMLTSADNYVLDISSQVKPKDPVRRLIVAAVMCIDLVLKE